MQRFMRERDSPKKKKLETKQAEYSKDSHIPHILMKFLWLHLSQVCILNTLYSNSPSLSKQVGRGRCFVNVSSLLLLLSLRGKSGCPEGFHLGIQMEKRVLSACHLHKVVEWDHGSSGTGQHTSFAKWIVMVPQASQEDGMGLRSISKCHSSVNGLWNGGRHSDHTGFLWKMTPQRPHLWLGPVQLIMVWGMFMACSVHCRPPSPGPFPFIPVLVAVFFWLHCLFPVGTVHVAARNIFLKHSFYHVPPQMANLLWWKSQTSHISP